MQPSPAVGPQGRGAGRAIARGSPLWIPPNVMGAAPVLMEGSTYLNLTSGLPAEGRAPWFEVKAGTDNRAPSISPVTAVAFDPIEELIWTGLDNVLTQYCYTIILVRIG